MDKLEPIWRAGDHVFHEPSGESWVAAWHDPETDELHPCGWPESYAKGADCKTEYKCTDEEHETTMQDMRKSANPNGRFSKAFTLYGGGNTSPNLPEAYGGCTCSCHSVETYHVVACCYPPTEETK